MLTWRGWSFLSVVVILLTLTVWTNTPALALVCLALLIWFLGSLFLFHLRIRLLTGRLEVCRQVHDERGPVQSLWAERTFTVHVELRSKSLLGLTYARAADRVPFGSKRFAGEIHADGELHAGKPLAITYHMHCLAAGLVRFEGVQLQLADLQGFFYHWRFVRAPVVYRVLPAFADARGRVPTVKRYNILPIVGPHRFHRPGSGSELLDLRDYLPGDPPKTIAWKVSARRDKLMTKVFESEVPLRCTFFVDVSPSVRVGSVGQNALARLVEITSALTQATAAFRDLPGVCLFDENGVQRWLRPNRTSRHVVQVLNTLAESASLMPASPEIAVTALLPLAHAFAAEVYPDLLDHSVNHCPWWLPWWSPRSAGTIRTVPPRRLRDEIWLSYFLGQRWRHFRRRLRQNISARLSGVERQRYRWRKKMAALLALQHDLGPGGLGLLLENDELFVMHLQRFLAEHNVPCTPPLLGPRGEYLYAAPGKVEVLARALIHAVTRGKDNELYVLLADLLELDDYLEPLLRAVKVARARHHQVVVVCPWPPGVPQPDPRGQDVVQRVDVRQVRDLAELRRFLEQTTEDTLHRAYYKLRRIFGKVGVPLLCAAQHDSVKLILERLERLRQPVRGVR